MVPGIRSAASKTARIPSRSSTKRAPPVSAATVRSLCARTQAITSSPSRSSSQRYGSSAPFSPFMAPVCRPAARPATAVDRCRPLSNVVERGDAGWRPFPIDDGRCTVGSTFSHDHPTREVGMAEQSAPSVGLRKNAIGLREALFQGITDMAPGAAIAASIPAGAAFAGGALPLSVVFALVACLLTASSVAELARQHAVAGSLATYAAQGLHQAVGFLVAWGYVLVGVLIPPLVLLQLGFTTAATLNAEWSALPGRPVVAVDDPRRAHRDGRRPVRDPRLGPAGHRARHLRGRACSSCSVCCWWSTPAAPTRCACSAPAHTPDARGLSARHRRARSSRSSPSAASRARHPLAEEAENPRRTIRLAVLGATLSIGVLYIFTTYAVDVAFGPDNFAIVHQLGRRVVGGPGPPASTGCSGCWCSWPSSTPLSPMPTPG